MIVAVGARFGALTVERGTAEGRVLCRCQCGRVAVRALEALGGMSACRVCTRQAPRTEGHSRRSRERVVQRPRTVSIQRLTKRDLERGRELYPEPVQQRPATRGECEHASRPCPFVGCRYHLYLDVNPDNGSIKINWPGVELDEMPATCALDVADEGGATLEEVGGALNVTRERVRQIVDGLTSRIADAFGEWAPEGST